MLCEFQQEIHCSECGMRETNFVIRMKIYITDQGKGQCVHHVQESEAKKE